jgi:hypothetical protein
MKRRQFLKTSITASALAGVASLPKLAGAAAAPSGPQEFYEFRVYRLKSGASQGTLDEYFERALIPALNRLGSRPVGVFVEKEPKEQVSVYTLIPHDSAQALAQITRTLAADAEYMKNGSAWLGAAKANPSFERIDSWLLLAFAGLPKIKLPAYCAEKKPRLFELRTYESFSEVKALKKVDMFNAGEIDVMHEVGLGPIFYGQALVGPNLPHLTYMTSGENEEVHKKHWDAFGKHPVWDKLKNDPQYADTVSKITKWILVPKPYSQI